MPIIPSAKKKLRQDKKRQQRNLLVKKAVRDAVNSFKKNPSEKLLPKVFSFLDQTAKKKIFHANKVARLKSRLSKLTGKKTVKPGTVKKISKKKSPKKQTEKKSQ